MTGNDTPILALSDVRYGFTSRPDFLGPIAVTVRRGQCLAIVGPNGAGKSTLLRLMAGLVRPSNGSVHLDDKPLPSITAGARARTIAFVPQHLPADLNLSAREIVLLARYPHRGLSLFESAEDRRVAEQAMQTTGVHTLADRSLATLSGGERQRVHIAAALAQQPQLLLLDEPTASLDLQHQMAIFRILRDRAARDGLAVVVVTHDVNLAARYCTQVLLLNDGRAVALGEPEAVVTPAVLEPVYGVALALLTGTDGANVRCIAAIDRKGDLSR